MSNNFNINPNFSINGFEKAFRDFNKGFSPEFNQVSGDDFNKIFNSIPQNQAQPLQGHSEFNVGLDTINAQKIENLSPSAKVAAEIGNGLSNSLNELNSFTRKAEEDFETFSAGGDISVHDVMISAQKSNLAMQMAIQLRNQMLNAYNEFKGMQIRRIYEKEFNYCFLLVD